jgi:hypothetical protein
MVNGDFASDPKIDPKSTETTHSMHLVTFASDFHPKINPKSTKTTHSMHLVTFASNFHPKIDPKSTETTHSMHLVTFGWVFHRFPTPEVQENVYRCVFGDFWMDFSLISDAGSARKRLPMCIWWLLSRFLMEDTSDAQTPPCGLT